MWILKQMIFVHLYLFVLARVKINNLKIPDGIEYNTTDEVILDCDYSYEPEDEAELVIKWYFPTSDNIIFQWIPSKDERKKPSIREGFKSIIDLDYTVSDNPFTMYRALKINKVTPEITGNYACSVSGPLNEDRREKRLVIYKKADSVEFRRLDSNTYVCMASGVHPEPILNIYVDGRNLTQIRNGNGTDNNKIDLDFQDGIYNATRSYQYQESEKEEDAQIVCELSIPDTNYHEIYSLNFLPDNSAVIQRLSGFALLAVIFVTINYYC